VMHEGDVVQVYTDARFSSGSISIPYYYLDDKNKADDMERVAGTYIGSEYNFGDVISYASAGSNLVNGHTTNSKLCFFGIIESDYWTNDARDLFEDCGEGTDYKIESFDFVKASDRQDCFWIFYSMIVWTIKPYYFRIEIVFF